MSRARDRLAAPIALLMAVAVILRLYGIGHQGLWYDEAFTVALVKMHFGAMLSTVPKTESTPYLYYVLVWTWAQVFGHGAAALRSFSALCGVATVPVVYLTARKLLRSERAAVIAAALTTFNPLLIWYSQEARAYELLVLAAASTLLAFAYLREQPTPGRFTAWAVVSSLALSTHYYAAVVVLPEVIWIVVQYRRHLGAWLATAFIAACGGGLLPLLVAQIHNTRTAWISLAPLDARMAQILPQFFLGTGSYAYRPLMYCAFALALLALGMIAWRGARDERAAATRIGSIAVGGFAVMMLVIWAGSDTLLTRNLVALWVPAALALAAALGIRRAARIGVAATVVLCAIGLFATVSVATDTTLQRPDWSGVARALGPWPARGQPAGAERLLLFQRNPWLKSLTAVYLADATKLGGQSAAPRVTEIDVIVNSAPSAARHHWLCWWGAGCNLYASRLQASYEIPGFHAVSRVRVQQFTILKLVAAAPELVTHPELRAALTRTRLEQDGLLIQRSVEAVSSRNSR